jgi:hypothetical protein
MRPLSYSLTSGLGWLLAVWIPALLFSESGLRDTTFLMATGFMLGVTEWLTVRGRTRSAAIVILWYGWAWYAAWRAGLDYGDFFAPNPFVLGGAGGGVVGLIQSVSLRDVAHRAWLWIPASAASGIAGCWLGVVAGVWFDQEIANDWGYPIGAIVAGLVMGLLRGVVLTRLPTK